MRLLAFKLPKLPLPRWGFAGVGLITFAFLLSVYVRVWTPEYGITKLFTAGIMFQERGIKAWRETPKFLDPYPPHRWGFDGQLYAELALDPLLLDPQLKIALDDPPYRSRRILLSWLAWLGGLGRPFWVLNVFAALNLVFWIGFAWLAARLFRPLGWAGLAGFAAVLPTCGVIECLHGSLTDFPGFVLMTAAVMAGGTGGAMLLALAALARETCLLGFVGLAEYSPPWRATLKKNILRGLVVTVPLVLWLAYVLWRFRDKEVGFDGGNFERPFAGIMGKLGEFTVTAAYGHIRWRRFFFETYKSYELHALLTIVSVVTQCVYLALHREWGSRLWRLGAVFVPYFLCIGFLSWESHFTVTRHALPITLAFNLLLAARPGRGWLAWFVLGNCFVPFGLQYFDTEARHHSPPPPAEFAVVAPATVGKSLGIAYAQDWSPQQWTPPDTWRWGAGPAPELLLRNASARTLAVELVFRTRSRAPRDVRVTFRGQTAWHGRVAQARQIVDLPLQLPPGESRLTFSSVEPPDDADDTTPGKVTFLVANPRLEVRPAGTP